MADNYLENQYEQYRARKAAWEKAKKSGKAQTLHKPTLPLKKGGKKVFVTGGAGGIGKAIVEAFCKLNYQVAFCDKNELEGQQTAQATGAQFYPVDLNSKVWGIERSGFFNGREKWAKGFENQRV